MPAFQVNGKTQCSNGQSAIPYLYESLNGQPSKFALCEIRWQRNISVGFFECIKVERALETATFFTHPKTFQVALAQAENRGNKCGALPNFPSVYRLCVFRGLCERLYSEIERRIIQENSKQVREQLKELDATLTPSQVLYDPATSPAEPQFLSIAQQVRRDMAASSHNSVRLDTFLRYQKHVTCCK